jgi:PAS domain S-box-containing protein
VTERFLLDQVEAAVVATDPHGVITHWNRFAEELLGYAASEAIDRDFLELIVDPLDVEAARGIIECLTSGAAWQGEVASVRKDGHTVRTRARTSPTLDVDGARIGMAAVIVDITDLKRSELRQVAQYAVSRVLSEAETLAEATPRLLEAVGETLGWEVGAIWEVDRTADRLRCAATWHAPGKDRKEFDALTMQTVFPKGVGLPGLVWQNGKPAWIEDFPSPERAFPRAPVAAEEGLHGAVAFPLLLGREVLGVIEFFSGEILEPDQDLITMMDAIGRQLGQFIERQEAEEDVRDSEARKSAILEGALDCVITADHEGRIVEFNPAAEETFGYSRDEVLGKQVAELIIPPALRERHYAAFTRHVESGGRPTPLQRVELTGMRSDGSEFPIEITVARIEVERRPMFTGFIRDITERKRIEEERLVLLALEQAAREETERTRDRSSFLAEASAALAGSLDMRKTLNKVARLAVSRLADWCGIDIEEDGELRPVAVAHADPTIVERTREFRRRWPPDMRSDRGAATVARTGRAELYSEISDELLTEIAVDDEHLQYLRNLGFHSAMVVPLRARGRTFGVITFVSAESNRRYGPEDLALAEELAARAAQAIDNARLYQERAHVARALQQSLLPQRLPEIEWLEVAARYRAAGEGEVGGDFYDLFEASPGTWYAVIGDVQGKGPEAAAVTGLARYTIRAVAATEHNPSQILRALNAAILKEGTDRFATVALARLQTTSGMAQLFISCGGHPLPFVLRASGAVEAADCKGNLLGVFPEPELKDYLTELAPGDALVFYTDGVTEEPAGDVVFGEEHLVPLLRECVGLDADAAAGRIEDAVLDFRAQPPRDDMAILVLRFQPDRLADPGEPV